MANQTHTIRKQIFEVKIREKEQAFQIQNRILETYKDKVIKILDELFADSCPEDKYIFIDKFEVDLGEISSAHLEEELTVKSSPYIRNALIEKFSSLGIQGSEKRVTPEGKILTDYYKKGTSVSPKHILSKTQLQLHLIKHFLKTGTLPWFSNSQLEDIDEILDSLIKSHSEDLKKLLQGELKSDTTRIRIAKQFSTEMLTDIVKLFVPKTGNLSELWLKDLSTLLQHTEKAGNELIIVRRYLPELLLKTIDKPLSEYSEKKLLATLLLMIQDKEGITPSLITEPLLNTAIKLEANKYKFETGIVPALKNIEKDGKLFVEKRTKTEIKKEKTSNFLKEFEGEEIYIQNSGIVILSSYLSSFFTKLEFIKNNHFVSKDTQMKCIQLLQYLVSGEKNNPEYLLPLNKLLCGLDISYPVEKEIEIIESEKKESKALLKSVIKNWSALKNTSIEGLRTSFLLRDGILKEEEQKALLRIERKPYDVLVDKIPWSISTIKLPWMKKILYVEW